MLGAKLTGSELGYHMALSPLGFGAAGSGNPIDLSAYEFATMVVAAGSINSGFAAYVQRSGASNGTFQGIGASVGAGAGGVTLVRSFALDASPAWYRVAYTNGTGSANVAILLIGQGARQTPLPSQPSGTTVFSTVLSA